MYRKSTANPFNPFVAALLAAGLLATLAGPVAAEENHGASVADLVLTNPSEIERTDAFTRLSLDTLGVDLPPAALSVFDGEQALPSQLIDYDGDGEEDSLVFVADFAPAQSRTVRIVSAEPPTFDARTQAEVSIKEGGRWEDAKYVGGHFVKVESVTPPEQYTDHSEYIRYEGPGIESDRVGYRIYLDWRNGFDIFGKKTDALVLQDVGQDGYSSYHEPSDWGMDVLKVGDSVGMGGYGFWDGKKVLRVSDVRQRSTRVIDNGPVYSQLGILYQGWSVDGRSLDLDARLAMKAGSRLVHTRLNLSAGLDNIAVGIVKHPGTTFLQGELEISGLAWTWVASWGKQSLSEDYLGMMLLFRKQDRMQQTEDEHNYVSVLQPRDGQVEYYFGAIWEQEPGGVTTEAAFRTLLEREAERLTMPLRQRLTTERSRLAKAGLLDAEAAMNWSRRLADAEIARNGESLSYGGFDTVSNRGAAWRYTTGLLAQAVDDLSQATGDNHFAGWAHATIDSYITDDGDIRTYDPSEYNIDKINSGKMLLRLYERFDQDKYRIAAGHLRDQLRDHPQTSDGAFWHKKRYPWQLWLDGVYMGMPFLAHYSSMTGDEKGLEQAVHEILVTREHLRDSETGLYYHAWDEKKQQVWADPDTGRSHYFWSRGMGWYAMATVDILDFVPADRDDLREPVLKIIHELADSLLAHRAGALGWYQVTDRPNETGNYPEASGSSMFVYMLAKAVNRGYLDETYRQPAIDAFRGLVDTFINVEADGQVSLMNICAVAGLGFGRDGTYRYYMSEPVISNDPKGTAPFIMAGIQVSQMLD